ncbi:MAG: hypothetical protein IPG45_23675 [Deltaproteobacteria bacterium]|nr:hypothetical protein [Deltaproteobacteria bacterium]
MILGLVLACGDDADPVEPTGIALEGLAAELAAADCARLEACGPLPGAFDRALCQERQAQIFYAPLVKALQVGSESGVLSYFELAAKDCRDAIGKLSCELGLDHGVLELPECAGMVSGSGTAGAACPLAQACSDGHYCGGATCPGTCTAFLGNNAACTANDRCQAGFYCDVIGRRCLAVAGAGQSCGLSMSGNSCAIGSHCDLTNPAAPVCRPVRGRGQGCGTHEECIVTARCILSRCSAGELGDGCQEQRDCLPGGRCAMGRCVAPLAIGEGCADTTPPCVEGARCEGGSCVATPRAGQPCPNSECYLGRCVAGTCVSLEPDGASCSAADECLPDRRCDGQRCALPLQCG